VLDSATHEGIPGVTVFVKGTDVGVSTNATGAFDLSMPPGATMLSFSSIGFLSQEIVAGASQPLQLLLAADRQVLGEMGIVVVGGLDYKRPWPWHSRRFFHWGKYWVTKPFRN
jgi:hypothetical protein